MILVTGATGFVGSYIVRYLVQAGEQVRSFKRPNSDFSLLGDAAAKVEWVEGDLTDIHSLQDAMVGVDKIYHCAAVVSFRRKDHKRMMKVNVEGTANVVNTALDMGVKKLLYVSSVVTLGKGKYDAVLDEHEENIDADYDTTYGLSKCLAEMEVWRAMMEGLNAVIINPSLIIGASRWNSYGPGMFGWINRGLPFYAAGSTGFVDVRDVAKVSIALMDSNIHNERFIISTENLSYRQIGNMIAKELGKRERTIPVPKWLLHFLSHVELNQARLRGRIPFISPENVQLFSRQYRYSSQKLTDRLEYEFIPIERTVKETAELFKLSKADGKTFATLAL